MVNASGGGEKPQPLINEASSLAHSNESVTDASAALDLLLQSGRLLIVNGQTTQQIVDVLTYVGERLGFRSSVFVRWGELTVHVENSYNSRYDTVSVSPTGVDMHRVAATMFVLEDFIDGRINAATMRSSLDDVTRMPPISVVRFALLAAVGAVALGVIFGDVHWVSLALIALSAAAGGFLRRWLAKRSHNLFVQPFCASLLAGVIGAAAVRLQLSSVLRLVAVCPCMVLVPGPHVLNGTIDLVRGRVPLGTWRMMYAGLVILMICTGLLVGLAIGGVNLPVSGVSHPVPIAFDVIAAGFAVAAYGTFFSMPWRTLPIPVLIGMAAHACRWIMISIVGVSVEMGAFVACLVVGIVVTPVADRIRMPFAAFAFASVVSLIPGVFIFRMAGGLAELATSGTQAPLGLLIGTIEDGMTAALIILAMTVGLIVPKMCIGHVLNSRK
jgi:uncharacterized membrane protein YjjP (DUF1212 family)